jgi:NTE family protein
LLCRLRDEGREAMGRWLAQNFDEIGVRSTVDVNDMFL